MLKSDIYESQYIKETARVAGILCHHWPVWKHRPDQCRNDPCEVKKKEGANTPSFSVLFARMSVLLLIPVIYETLPGEVHVDVAINMHTGKKILRGLNLDVDVMDLDINAGQIHVGDLHQLLRFQEIFDFLGDLSSGHGDLSLCG